ncbi:MAG TPA: DUF58 domain-containing protein [Pilimelia sp.]|nr:DUF58 domain-containing protein [Pilimelia sp.]
MRITARGVGLSAAGVAALAAGFGFGYAELTVLGTAALVAVLLACGGAAWRPPLEVSREAEPDRVGRGAPCAVVLTVRNTSRLRVATLVAEDRCGRRAVPVPLVRLRPGRETTVRYPVPTDRRGVVPVGPLRISRVDPLGLVTVRRGHGAVIRVWVHPRVHPLTAVPAGVARSLDGRVDRVPHGSITFDALREYVVGDELRHVHWRTSARVGELMVREHVDTSLPRLVVLLDDRAAGYGARSGAEAFESACEAAASVVVAALRADLAVALHLASGAAIDSAGRRGTGGARPYLDLLAEAEPSRAGRAELRRTVQRLRHRPPGDTLVYLTGAGGEADLGPVAALRGGYAAVLAAVFRPEPADATDAANAATRTPGRPGGGAGSGVGPGRGLLVLRVGDGADFAAEWNGVRAW